MEQVATLFTNLKCVLYWKCHSVYKQPNNLQSQQQQWDISGLCCLSKNSVHLTSHLCVSYGNLRPLLIPRQQMLGHIFSRTEYFLGCFLSRHNTIWNQSVKENNIHNVIWNSSLRSMFGEIPICLFCI